MAFRVRAFENLDFAPGQDAGDLPCVFVGDDTAADAILFSLSARFFDAVEGDADWLIPYVAAAFGLAVGATIDANTPIWIVMPPNRKDFGLAKAFTDYKRASVVYNADPVAGLGTHLRRAFIGIPYSDYLQTRHWQEVREAALNRADFACQLCNSTERLQVHHRTYERRGGERDGDVIVLCGACHQRFHDRLPKEA